MLYIFVKSSFMTFETVILQDGPSFKKKSKAFKHAAQSSSDEFVMEMICKSNFANFLKPAKFASISRLVSYPCILLVFSAVSTAVAVVWSH